MVGIFLIIEFLILTTFFKFGYSRRGLKRKVSVIQILFVIGWLIELLFFSNSFPKNSLISEYLIFIILIILFFYDRMNNITFVPIYHTIVFWICVGLFILFSSNLFAIITLFIYDNPDIVYFRLTLMAVGIITKNVILSLSLLGKNETEEKRGDSLIIPDDVILDDFKLTNLKKH